MTKRMLIDATNAEETRVVVLEGNRLEDFDVETQSRRQLKGNIYLAKVVRVEPSLQAAFVEYGGNRHGFLAFGEIHPDYYQIPVADRQRLLQMQEEEARAEEEAEDRLLPGEVQPPDWASEDSASPGDGIDAAPEDGAGAPPAEEHGAALTAQVSARMGDVEDSAPDASAPDTLIGADLVPEAAEIAPTATEAAIGEAADSSSEGAPHHPGPDPDRSGRLEEIDAAPAPPPEMIGGEQGEVEDLRARVPTPRFLRSYKIQEVIRRRQILLVQVVKEERGTKGAALTTYISLAGRYCVLMPNSPRGGGISRKITSAADRRRLKDITTELEIPRGMGVIVRTAGANRPKPEIKRDCEYLLRLWDGIRDLTLQSMAPALIHEEASLIKRAIRDVYSREIEEILVDGSEGWKQARDYMRLLMPTHAKKVQLWSEPQPLFAQQGIEQQLDSILNPTVQLRSGGYIVIDQTEALVAIDVNSGRSTRERGIEETALRTNIEAAEEVARQVRLRDLAGLIVVDFIDMEAKRNVAAVERRLKDALKDDRARIQVGSISHFGLLEMSRQRLRPSLAETTLTACPHCNGAGRVRSVESAALHVIRAIEEEGGKRRAAEICVYVAPSVAFYILNNKRARLAEIEERWQMRIAFAADDSLQSAQLRFERLRPQTAGVPTPRHPTVLEQPAEAELDESDEGTAEDFEPASAEAEAEAEPRRRRRRRRRRGGRVEESGLDAQPMPQDAEQPELDDIEFPGDRSAHATASDAAIQAPPPPAVPGHDEAAEGLEARGKAPRRGRRGGRRSRKDEPQPDPAPLPPAYSGPTPADPFGGSGVDVFEAMERAEAQRHGAAHAAAVPASGAFMNTDAETVVAAPAADESTEVEPEPAPPVTGPAVQPIVVGSGEPATERKRGWWRR